MPVDPQDLDRALKAEKLDPAGFDVWYGKKLVHYEGVDRDKINLDAATRITVVFPEHSRGSIYVGNGDGRDNNRVRIRRPAKKG